MAPLKSLEQYPAITNSHFLEFCASYGILSVEDFLLHDIYEFAAFAEQQPDPETLKEGIEEVLSLVDAQRRQPWLNGMELLADSLQNKHVLSTGCQGVDMLLGGGLREGQLTELVGPSSSGKTQVCLQAASNVSEKHMGRVVYLDTSNSFSPQRIANFVDLGTHNFLQNVMKNILCHSVFDIFTMFDVLHQLELNLGSQLLNGPRRVRLIIIDSISSLITPILGGSGLQGHSLMTSAGFLLKKLAHEHNLVVLVTNHTVGGDGGIPKPALGETWKSIPHVRLMLSRDRGNNSCSVSIIKHPSMYKAEASPKQGAAGEAASFTIRSK